MQEDLQAVGSLRSNESVVLRPEVSGRIATIGFRDGQVVKKGQLLIGLDSTLNEAEVAQYRAEYDLALSNLKRSEDLARQKFISSSAQETAASNAQVAEARLKLAQARLSKMKIVSPFDGIVGIRGVSLGDYVKDGTDLVNIEDVRILKVDFRLPERSLSQIKAGQDVEVVADALPNERWQGQIEAINPRVDANGRSLELRGRLDNASGKLRPGMFVRVRVIVGERNGLLVPEEAIVPSRARSSTSTRWSRGAAKRVPVKIGVRRRRQGRDRRRHRAGRPGRRPPACGCRATGNRCACCRRRARQGVTRADREERRGAGPGRAPARADRRQGDHGMSLFEVCIRRPVLSTVLSVLVLVIGLISYSRLSVREYPKIDEPVVSVQTTYPGASAEVVESQITKVLEDSLAGIEGVELLTSFSRSERSNINVRFRLTRDPDSAAADVRDKVARVARAPAGQRRRAGDLEGRGRLVPRDLDGGDGRQQSPLEVSDYLNRYVKPRLSVLPGAADVWIFGERKSSMRIAVDRDRLAGYRLTVSDVENALRRQNVELPSGRIESANARVLDRRRDGREHARAVREPDRRERRAATRCGSATSPTSASALPRSA